MVRKGIERGLSSTVDRDVAQLHAIYAESVRNLGTPVFAPRYFRILPEVFGENCDVVTIRDGEEAIAAVMNFYFRDEVLPYYGGGRAIARERYGNDFMYWEVMRRAAARGCARVRFRPQQARHRRVRLQEELGFRAGAAALSLTAWRRVPRSRTTTR